ncbi:MAG: hypothetical protein QM831_23385 [Kofleriaceae bacterium]
MSHVQPEMALHLPNLRLAFECKESWDAMVGDDQVRHCGSCHKQVFNLSEMTADEARAVLASRGVTPCVRFYRRKDGTVMTSDCPTGQPQRKKLAVVASGVALSLSAASAYADPDPNTDPCQTEEQDPPQQPKHEDIDIVMGEMPSSYDYTGDSFERPLVEWSAFGRLGVGVETTQPSILARSTTAPSLALDTTFEAALDAELTLGVARDRTIRLGAYGELRTLTDPVVGGELMFEDTHTLVVRAGGGAHVFTAGLGFGWTDTHPEWAHHVFGPRVMTTFDHSTDDPRAWSLTIGLEVDPIGVVQKLLR